MRIAGPLRMFGRIAAACAIVAMLLLPVAARPAVAAPQTAEDLLMPRYFPETGFWVQGLFREYWETHGGLFVHGYPITGVFEQDGYLKQYFERSVFEYHPENESPYDVLLMRLGAIRTEGRQDEPAFQPIPAFTSSEDHTYYPETGHALSYGFKAFWNEHGGLPNFGYPLSEEFDERNAPPPAGDGEVHTVQYFERSRFEWHPELRGTPYEVLLGLLGREYLAARGAPASAIQHEDPAMPPRDPITGRQYGPHAGYGFNIAWRGDGDGEAFHQQTLDRVREAGFNWIRIQVRWSEIERSPGVYDFAPLDRIVNTANQNGAKVLASVVHSPDWAGANGGIPADTAAFQTLMTHLAQRYAGRVQAWEIWNEQNLAREAGATINVAGYVSLLKAGYNGVKTGDPNAVVLFGGLTPTGLNDPSVAVDDVEYLRQVYAFNDGEVRAYFDAIGAHPGSNNNPPDTMWPDNPGPGPGWQDHPSFYFRRIEQLRQVMIDNGDAAKQIWLTEFGWTTANQAPGYEYGAQNSEQEQADYLVRAFQIGRQEWPWVGPMFVWNLNFSIITDPADEKSPWSVLNADWSPRPAYSALKDMPK